MTNMSMTYTDEYYDRFVWYLLWYTGIGVIQGIYKVIIKRRNLVRKKIRNANYCG